MVTVVAKRKLKLSKQRSRQAKAYATLLFIFIVGVAIGWLIAMSTRNKQPNNVVWSIDESVAIPSDLRRTLDKQVGCESYRGPGTPSGVGLWGVQQIEQDKFAKVVHGCSWSLDGYVMFYRENKLWQKIDPKVYFAPSQSGSGRSALPNCSVLEKYSISQSMEAFCIQSNGKAKANAIK